MGIDLTQNSTVPLPGEFDHVRATNRISRPKLTFFYKKRDGTIFAAEEQEAATRRYNTKSAFTFVGWSDGRAYQKTLADAKLKSGQLLTVDESRVILTAAFQAELKVAIKNLKDAEKNDTRIPAPKRIEAYFGGGDAGDGKDPMQVMKDRFGNAALGIASNYHE